MQAPAVTPRLIPDAAPVHAQARLPLNGWHRLLHLASSFVARPNPLAIRGGKGKLSDAVARTVHFAASAKVAEHRTVQVLMPGWTVVQPVAKALATRFSRSDTMPGDAPQHDYAEQPVAWNPSFMDTLVTFAVPWDTAVLLYGPRQRWTDRVVWDVLVGKWRGSRKYHLALTSRDWVLLSREQRTGLVRDTAKSEEVRRCAVVQPAGGCPLLLDALAVQTAAAAAAVGCRNSRTRCRTLRSCRGSSWTLR